MFASLSGTHQQMKAEFCHPANPLDQEYSALVSNDVLNFLDMRRHIYSACREAATSRKPLSLLMVAIDELPELTANYGEMAAEQANCFVMSLLSYHREMYFGRRNRVLIGEYVPGRYLMLLPETAGLVASDIAEYFRKIISENAFVCNSRQIWLTVSVGVVFKPAHDGDQDFMVLQADRACAEAERAGGDKVFLARSMHPDWS